MYTDALNTSLTAQGTLSQQNAIYLQSFTAKLHQFQAALDDVKDSALDEETLKDFVDFGTDAVTLLARFIDGIGGMRGVLVGIGALLPKIFDKQLNSTFTTLLTNIQRVKHNTEEANAVLQITSKFTQYAGKLKDPQMKVQLDTLVKMRETANQYRNVMSQADNEHYNALIKQKAELMNQSNTYKEFIDKTVKYAQDISGKKILSGSATDTKTGQILNTHGSDGAYTFAEKGEENLSKIKEALNDQVAEYDKAVNDIDDIFNKEIKNRQDFDKAVETKAKDFQKQAKEAEKAASKLQKEVENLNKAADQALDKSADLTDKYYAEEAGKIPQAESDTWKRSEEFEAQRKQLEEEAREKTKEVENLKEKADELRDQAEETREEIQGLSDIFLNAADSANEYANRLKDTPLDKYSKKITDLTTILNDNTASQEAKKSALRDLKGIYNQIRGQIEATSASIEEQTEKQKAAEEQAKAFELAKAQQEAQMEIQETANRITESIQAVSSFGFALNSVNGIIDSIADKNLSISDKLAQIFTVLPMAITSSVSAISSLNTALGTNIGILDILGKAKLLDNALDTKKIGLLKILSILSKNKTKDQIANAIAIEAGTTAQEIQNAATEKGIALDKLAIAVQKARWALSIVGVILAVAAAIKILLTIQQKQIEAQIEENQKIYDNIQAKKEQLKTNQDLVKSYQSVYEQYKAGTASKEQMADAANSLSGILNSEAIAVANLTGNYDDLTRAVNETSEKLREEERRQAEQQSRAAANILRLKESSISDDIKRTVSFDNILDTALVPFTGSGNVVVTGNANLLTINGERPEDIIKTYDQMTQAINLANGKLGAYQRILQRYQKEYAEFVEQLRQSVEWTNEIAIQDTLANQTYDSIESFEKNVEEIEKQLIENGVSEEDAKDKAIQYASTFSKESALAFKRYATANEILGDTTSEKAIKDVHEVINKLNEEQLGVVLQIGLDEQHIDNWIKATQAAVDISEATEGLANLRPAIDNLHKGTELEAEAIQKLEAQYSELADIWDKSSNQYLAKLREIAQLEEERIQTATRSQLASARDTVERNINAVNGNHTAGKDYKQYVEDTIDRLEKSQAYWQEQVDNIEYTQKKQTQLGFGVTQQTLKAYENATEKLNEASQALEKFNGQLEDTDKLSEKMTDLDLAQTADNLDELTASFQAYTQQILKLEQLKTEDLVTDADDVIDQAQNIAKALELIKDGFTVDADSYEELFRIFPQLASAADVLADGTIRLNEEVVQSTLQRNSDIMASDMGVTEASIKNRITELEAHKGELKAQLEAVQNTDAETLAEKGKLQELLGDSYDEYTTQVVQASADQALDEIANAKESTRVIINLWNEKIKAAKTYAAVAAAAQADGHDVSALNEYMADLDFDADVTTGESKTGAGKINQSQQDAKARLAQEQAQLKASVEEYLKNAILSDQHQIADLTIALGKLHKGIDDIGTAAKGAGSDAKTATKDLLDELKDELDIYHDINIQLGDIETALNRIADNEDKLVRSGLTENLEKQNELLDKQVETLKRKAELQQQDALNRSAELSALGATFDAYGNISNYMDLLTAKQSEYNGLVAEYNALMTEYNALGSKDAQQAMQPAIDALKDKIDQTKDDYDDLKDKIADYDSLKDAIDELQDDIIDSINKKIENNIKAFKIKIDVQLDKNEYQRDWNQFQKTANRIAEDNYKELSKNRLASFHSYYNTEGTGDVQELISQLNKTRAEVEKMEANQWSDIYGHNEAQALEDLKTYNDRLMQSLEDVEQIVKDIHDNYLSEIDKAKDAFDDQISQYEHINKLIGHGKNLTSLLYGDDDYDKLSKYYDMQAQNSNAQIDFYRRQTQLWKQNMDAAKEGSDEWKKFRSNWQNSVSDMNTAVESAVSNLIDKYTAATNDIIKKTRDQMAGGSWSKMQSEWDKYKWDDDRYLDQLTRATEIANFTDEVNKAMQGLNPKQQQTLLKFMNDQVDKLSQEGDLRAFNVEVANRELEILKQQMALEDARNAKTTMRLRRDSQGNYTYQYVADTTAADDAAATLRNSIEELRQFVESDMESSMDELMQKSDEFAQKWAEVCEQNRGNDEALKQAQLALQEEYFGQNGYITKLNQDYNIAQQDLFDAIGAEYGTLMNDLGADTRNFLGIGEDAAGDSVWGAIVDLLGTDGTDGRIPTVVDAFVNDKFGDATTRMAQMNQNLLFGQAQGQEGLVPGWNDATLLLGKDIDKLTETVKNSMDKCVQENKEYIESLDKVEESAGVDFNNIDEYVESTSQKTQELIQDNQELIDKYGDEIAAVAAVCAEMAELTAAYEANRDAALECAEANYKMWQSAEGFNPDTVSISSQTATKAASEKAKAATGGGAEALAVEELYVPPEPDPSPLPSPANLDKYYYLVGSTGKIYDKNDNQVGQWNRYQTDPYGVANTAGLYDQNGKLLKIIKRYKSGGYTGTWSNGSYDGMPALLHQKEYVLNAQDTPNVLRAVQIANRIMDSLSGLGTAAIDSMLSGRTIPTFSAAAAQSTNQNVNIYADFPNVSDALEIKNALNTLVNRASQMVSQNRRTY